MFHKHNINWTLKHQLFIIINNLCPFWTKQTSSMRLTGVSHHVSKCLSDLDLQPREGHGGGGGAAGHSNHLTLDY